MMIYDHKRVCELRSLQEEEEEQRLIQYNETESWSFN